MPETCDNDEKPAFAVISMLETTSLDGVAKLCVACIARTLGSWLLEPEDIAGFEIRRIGS